MPKLYYTATSCGAASFIAAFSAGLTLDSELVDISTHKTASGADFYSINSKGNVPALVLDNGTVLNENVAVLNHIATLANGKLGPVSGDQHSELLNALSYIATEVHPSIGHLFAPSLAEEVSTYIRNNAGKKLTYLNTTLIGDKQYLVGESFSVADSYLYIVISWTKYVGIDITPYEKVTSYFERIGSLENVKAAHNRIATSPATTF